MRAVVLVAAAALVTAPAAGATSAPSSQVRALAAAALHDRAALSRLEAIDRVDGRPMSLRALLAGASGADLRARLELLATGGRVGSTAAARKQAKGILNGRRFRGSPVPRPLHGVLVWFGNIVHDVVHALAWPFRRLGIRGPTGGGWWSALWLLIGALVVGAAVYVVLRLARGRGGLHVIAGGSVHGRSTDEDPAGLEQRADEAERAGDLTTALRLRFRAGLLRLARARVIPARSSVTTCEVRRAVRSSEFDELARTFDEVVYGRREARPDDLERARATWPRVIEATASR